METVRNFFRPSPPAPPGSSTAGNPSPPPASDPVPSSKATPTLAPPEAQRNPDLLSDSEISVLDLGPSMDEPAHQRTPSPIPEVRISPPESEASTVKPEKPDRTSVDDRDESPVDGQETPRSSPKRLRPRHGAGGVVSALRTISSPLLGPLRTAARPGVHRARTSFWRGKDD